MEVLKMRIFISHASKNKEIVLKFADFLEEVNNDIEVFCSSESGNIKVGKNFIETIFEELNHCDLFIPIISKEYYASKFCMTELGVAYSYLYKKYQKQEEDYIFPFVLYPVQKGEALSGTPMANIQVGELSSEEDIRSFLSYLKEDRNLNVGSGINRKLHSFKYDIDQIYLKNQNIVEISRINVYFDDSINYKKRSDIVDYSVTETSIMVNFNMNPYEQVGNKYPNFISLVLRYVDKLDLGRYLDFNPSARFQFILTNFTNSLKKIYVEFKYSDNHVILETFELPVVYGENHLEISLEKMRSKALNNISEICFVIHPEDVVEEEGMFKVESIKIH